MKSKKNKKVFVKNKKEKEKRKHKEKIQFRSKLLIWSQGKVPWKLYHVSDAQHRGHERRYLKSRMVVWVFPVMRKRRHLPIKQAWGRKRGTESGYSRQQDQHWSGNVG